jgi:hypothetical protein
LYRAAIYVTVTHNLSVLSSARSTSPDDPGLFLLSTTVG